MNHRLAIVIVFLWNNINAEICSNTNPCLLREGENLRHPKQLFSVNQKLEITLKVDVSEVTVGGWLKLWRRTYNGQIGGPTLRLRPGDDVIINLINALAPNGPEEPHNSLRWVNSTNVYFHGLHISPQENNLLTMVEPGNMKRYHFTVGCSHPSGTYWYHPHLHGSSLFQTMGGMAGMVVIEDSSSDTPDYLSDISCPSHCEHEVQLLFQPTLLYKSQKGELSFTEAQEKIGDDEMFRNLERMPNDQALQDWLQEQNVQYFTTNGQLFPRITIQSGQTKRFRMVNAGGIHSLEIDVPKSESGNQCDVYEIAKDGRYLQKAKKTESGQTILPPGGRVDWLIRCTEAEEYAIRSIPASHNDAIMGDSGRIRADLAMIRVIKAAPRYKKSSLSSDELFTFMKFEQSRFDLLEVEEDEVRGRFIVEVGGNNEINRERFPKPSNIRIRHKMPMDGIQEWNLLNTNPVISHSVHMPANHFQVISFNKYRGPVSNILTPTVSYMTDLNGVRCEQQPDDDDANIQFRPYKFLGVKKNTAQGHWHSHPEILQTIGTWRDTIILPSLSNITIRFIPRDFTGYIFVQTANLLRSDMGMVMTTEIVAKDQPTDDSDVEVGGLPGTCHRGDFYPVVSTPDIHISSRTLSDFFLWLYKYKPEYTEKYGDQRYIAGLYGAYLAEQRSRFSSGTHLKDFFKWLYEKFPSYEDYYGDQSYLCEIYDYYIERILARQSVKKTNLG